MQLFLTGNAMLFIVSHLVAELGGCLFGDGPIDWRAAFPVADIHLVGYSSGLEAVVPLAWIAWLRPSAALFCTSRSLRRSQRSLPAP